VADACRAENPSGTNTPGAPLAAVLYAAKAKEEYFKLSDAGRIEVTPEGRTKFTPSAGGSHRYLILDVTQKDRITAEYIRLASAKPVPRPARGRGPQ
jgi:hypothetical protein